MAGTMQTCTLETEVRDLVNGATPSPRSHPAAAAAIHPPTTRGGAGSEAEVGEAVEAAAGVKGVMKNVRVKHTRKWAQRGPFLGRWESHEMMRKESELRRRRAQRQKRERDRQERMAMKSKRLGRLEANGSVIGLHDMVDSRLKVQMIRGAAGGRGRGGPRDVTRGPPAAEALVEPLSEFKSKKTKRWKQLLDSDDELELITNNHDEDDEDAFVDLSPFVGMVISKTFEDGKLYEGRVKRELRRGEIPGIGCGVRVIYEADSTTEDWSFVELMRLVESVPNR